MPRDLEVSQPGGPVGSGDVNIVPAVLPEGALKDPPSSASHTPHTVQTLAWTPDKPKARTETSL